MAPEASGHAQRVPEHSLPLMQAMSGGRPFTIGEYLFFSADDWLMAIAYPLHGKYAHSDFSNALASAQKRVAPVYCYAIGPDFPAEFNDRIIERDRYYILAADAPIPKKLVNPVRKAAQILEVRESMAFTPAHRRLWAEFLENRGRMPDRVAGLYTRAPTALAEAGGSLRLLDAIDPAEIGRAHV